MSNVKLRVDGEEIEASEGDTILEACEKNDIYVPTLCRYVGLSEVGACRMCLVQIDGERLETACTTKVEDGMEVEVNTEELWDHRRTILELIFSEENHYCMYCELEGDCELEEMFRRAGMTNSRFPLSFQKKEVDSTNEYITIDRNRCILCGRCIRACREKVCNDTLDFGSRGKETKIIADNDLPLGESSCISCGACAQACPTGSIFESHSSYRGNGEECESSKSTCVECSIGCGIEVLTRSDNLVKINGAEVEDLSGGQLCKKGRFKALNDNRERVENALVKKNGQKTQIPLEEAIKKVKTVLKDKERINALMSDRLPTETLKSFKKTLKKFGSYINVLGSEKHRLEDEIIQELKSMDAKAEDEIYMDSTDQILEAENILVYGTEIVNTHPVIGSYVRKASKNGSRLITVDPDEDLLKRHSDISINLGSPESHLTGITLEALRKNVDSLSELSNLRLEDININTSDLMQMVTYLKKGENNVLVISPEVRDTQSLINIYALAILTGSKTLSLEPISNQAIRDIKTDPLDGSAEVSYLFASDEDGGKLEKMIDIAESSDFVIVQAARHSELTKIADIVLPALDWFERSGTFTDINGQEREIKSILEPKISLESDTEILDNLREENND